MISNIVDELSNVIRTVDGGHTLGASALAEALQPWLAEHDRQVRTEAICKASEFQRAFDRVKATDAATQAALADLRVTAEAVVKCNQDEGYLGGGRSWPGRCGETDGRPTRRRQ